MTNKSLGKAGENEARNFLSSLGYTFLDKNWRYGKLELDLIFMDKKEIVFVEVKTRSSNDFGGAAEAVSHVKKKNMINAAQGWLMAKNLWETPCRFDIVCITKIKDTFKLVHYKNAFGIW